MIEVASRRMECTHFILEYSRMPAVAIQSVLKKAVIGLDVV